MDATHLALAVVVTLIVQPLASRGLDENDCVFQFCIEDRVRLNNIRTDPPQIAVELINNTLNELQLLTVAVRSADASSQVRCLPYGNPHISTTVRADTAQLVLPLDVPAMDMLFLNCSYTIELTLPDQTKIIRNVSVHIPRELSGIELKTVNSLQYAVSPGGLHVTWEDRDPIWVVGSYEVTFTRQGSIMPEAIVAVGSTERLADNDRKRHGVFYPADTRYSCTIQVYSVGVASNSFGVASTVIHTPEFPITDAASPSPVVTFEVGNHTPRTKGDVPGVSAAWNLDQALPGIEDANSLQLTIISTEGIPRCLSAPGFFIISYPTNATSATFSKDFPVNRSVTIQYGCAYSMQLSVTINGTVYASEVLSTSTSRLVPLDEIETYNKSLLQLQATVTTLETNGNESTLDVNVTWLFPALSLPPPFFEAFSTEVFTCSEERANENIRQHTIEADAYIGQQYAAVRRRTEEPEPYCMRVWLAVVFVDNPLEPAEATVFRARLTVRRPSPTQVPVTVAESYSATAGTAQPSRVPGSTATPAASVTSRVAIAARATGAESSVSLTIVVPVTVASVLLLLACVILAIARHRSSSRELDLPVTVENMGTIKEDLDLNDFVWQHCPTKPDAFAPLGKTDKLGEVGVQSQVQVLVHNLHLHGFAVHVTGYLGAGQFGKVFKAELEGDDDGGDLVTDVAIKTLHANATETELKQFHDEIAIMKDLEPHGNVIRMLGCCEEGLASSCLIVEFMPHGNLQDFLQDARCRSTHTSLSSVDPYHNERISTEHITVEITPNGCLGMKDTLNFAIQIAAGMMHLQNLEIVHRDLAARNVLLGNGKVVKISDFGLAQDIYQVDIVREKERKGTPLPYKWMALESLMSHVFTSASDVWSYGIVLWEIVMTGAHPYPTVDNCDIPALLESGQRLPKPADCTDGLYSLMQESWDEVPENRPTFTEISETLDELNVKFLQYVDLAV